jgi:pSer/pThr/pTyr-binding forkhead associated (FHA) protein
MVLSKDVFAMRIILQAEPNRGIEDIVIEEFPFLIGRTESHFSPYEKTLPEHLRKLSRRHARIFLEGDRPYVEDLGSTNGTFWCGERLEDRPTPLRNGDALAFGPFFQYVISLDQPETQPPKAQPVGESTIYMSDPSSFLGMMSSEKKGEKGPRPSGTGETPSRAATPSQGPPSQPGEKKRLFAALMAEFWGRPDVGLRRKWYLLGLIGALLVAGGISAVILSSPERKLKKLMKEHRYAECSAVANDILREDSQNEGVCDIATEALIKAILPDWTTRLRHSRFADARAFLASAAARNRHNPDGLRAIGLLLWVTDLEEFFAERKGDTPLTMFHDEEQVASLMDRWEKERDSNRSLMDQISNYDPSFAVIQRQMHSHLNALKTIETMKVEPTQELKETIESLLGADRPEALVATVEDFRRKYPTIGGIEALEKDLSAYLVLWKAVESQQLLKACELLEAHPFQTKPFVDKVRRIREEVLPSPSVIEAYRMAAEAWSSGAPKRAISIVEPLVDEKWGEVAERKLKHYRQVLQDFAMMEASRDTSDYSSRLLSFYGSLLPGEDEVFLRLIEDDFKKVEKEALRRSQAFFTEAQAKWDNYLKDGRISGLLRLDTKVSEAFRRKAGLLRSAFDAFSSGAGIYRLLDRKLPGTYQSLEKAILDEVRTQRLRLNDLRNVLDPIVSSEKLALLPNPSEEKD